MIFFMFPARLASALLPLDAGPVRELARMLKGHAEIAHVDPVAASGALHEMIGVAFGRPVFGLPDDFPGLYGWQRCAAFLHARFVNSSNRFLFVARHALVLIFSQSRVGPE